MSRVVWHSIEADEALLCLESSATGLTTKEVQKRLAEHGPNTIPEKRHRSLLRILLGQFTDFMIVVLLVAALISGFIGELQDTIAILVIVMLNAIIGTVQEFRAERAVAALREMAAPEAHVLRDGKAVSLASVELVPGDVIRLEAGNVNGVRPAYLYYCWRSDMFSRWHENRENTPLVGFITSCCGAMADRNSSSLRLTAITSAYFRKQGIERYGHLMHSFCCMSNHTHLAVQVGRRTPFPDTVKPLVSLHALGQQKEKAHRSWSDPRETETWRRPGADGLAGLSSRGWDLGGNGCIIQP